MANGDCDRGEPFKAVAGIGERSQTVKYVVRLLKIAGSPTWFVTGIFCLFRRQTQRRNMGFIQDWVQYSSLQ